MPGSLLRRSIVPVLAIAALAAGGLAGSPRPVTPAHAATLPVFGPTTIVDDQREGGEPDVTVCGPSATWSYGNCGGDNPYTSWPYGFSTTDSFISRSEDQGHTFKLVPSNNAVLGKPNACPGGGDTELKVSPGRSQSEDYLTFEDLQGLTNFSVAASPDGGTDWQGGPGPLYTGQSCDPATTDGTAVDRQWTGLLGNPSGAPGNGSKVFLDYDMTGGQDCTTAQNAAGNEFVVQESTNGGRTYDGYGVPNYRVVDCNDGIAGNVEVNQQNGDVFLIHTAYESTSCTSAADSVVVNRSTDGGQTFTRHVVFQPAGLNTTSCTGDVTTGQDFAVLTIDKSGGLYAVWSQAPVDSSGNITGPDHIYFSYSSDNGTTWSAEKQVDQTAATGETNDVNLFPWIAAGNAGSIDVIWYGTTRAAGVTSYDPGKQNSYWYPYLSQSTNANLGSSATFSPPVRVADHSNHFGSICTMGIGCTTGGDRSLADFIQVTVNKEGGADVVWADTSNNSNTSASGDEAALIDEARQISGPTLFGTALSGTRTTCDTVGSTPCVADPAGDARYEANNTIGANTPKLDITGSSIGYDQTGNIDVRMWVPGISTTSLPTAGDTGLNASDAYVDYLTTWVYHNPAYTNDSNYDATGNIYYAYLEVNTATGTVTSAAAGTTCALSTTHAKVLTYPGQYPATSAVSPSGIIDVKVPAADVGNPADGATLYSVTAHTVGQPGPAAGVNGISGSGDTTCLQRDPNGNLLNNAGQIFNVYDKSPAYTARLTRGATLAALSRVSARVSPSGVTFRWRVGVGQRPVAFDVLARHAGRLVRVNRAPIPAHAARTYVYRTALSWTVRQYYIRALYAHGTQRFGPYTVTR